MGVKIYEKWLNVLRENPSITPRQINTAFKELEKTFRENNSIQYLYRIIGIREEYSKSLEEIKILDLSSKLQKRDVVRRTTVQNLIELLKEIVGMTKPKNRKIFVVHGHNDAMRLGVQRFLEKADCQPIVLVEEPSKGMAIIEKLEHYSDVAFAIVLLSPDDVGYKDGHESEKKARARQNVILELGYFMAKLGRGAVTGIYKAHDHLTFETPSDLYGVVYIEHDTAGAWERQLADELDAFGFDINYNKLFKRGTP